MFGDQVVVAVLGRDHVHVRVAFGDVDLETSGNAVGLPKGQMGNSEVGHMNIGAGRIVSDFDDVADLADQPESPATFPARLGRQVPGEWIGEPRAAIADMALGHPA